MTDINEQLKAAIEAFEKLTPVEQEAMRAAQRRSWIRGELGIGSDADEAAYRRAIEAEDKKLLKKLKAESTARVRDFERRNPR